MIYCSRRECSATTKIATMKDIARSLDNGWILPNWNKEGRTLAICPECKKFTRKGKALEKESNE